MNKLIKSAWQIVLPLALGGFILWWVYRDFDFSRVTAVLFNEMNWWWMVLSLLFGVMSHVIRGLRWKQTLEPLGAYPKTSNAINAVFVSYASNLIVPRVGEVSRCGVLAKYDGVSFSKSLGTVVTERLIDGLCVILITALALVIQMPVFLRFFTATGTNIESFTDVLASVQFWIIVVCAIGIIALAWYLVRTLTFFEKVRGVVLNVWEGVLSLRSVKNKPKFIIYTFLIWFCYFMQFYVAFFCFSFTAHLGLTAALVMFVCGSIAVIVPTPNGAGPWHFAIISMMVLYGVGEINAGIFALIAHGFQTFLVVLLGIYGIAALPITNKK